MPRKAKTRLRLRDLSDVETFGAALGMTPYNLAIQCQENPGNFMNILRKDNCTLRVWRRIQGKAVVLAESRGFDVET